MTGSRVDLSFLGPLWSDVCLCDFEVCVCIPRVSVINIAYMISVQHCSD